MSGYRFCRSDDVPLLVEAYNRCYRPHFPGLPELTVERFKNLFREIDLWTSSCMVAFASDESIGVLLSAKRKTESLIHRIGVHPDHVGRDHGSHLITSLSQKLAILTPRRIVVEVPEKSAGSRRFFERCGFRFETWLDDLEATGGGARIPLPAEPVTVGDLEEAGALPSIAGPRVAWDRSLESLRWKGDELRGWAVVSDVRVEAWLLAAEAEEGALSLSRLGSSGSPEGEASLAGLLRALVNGAEGPVRIPRVSSAEIPEALAAACGFRRERRHVGLALEPEPA